MKVIPATGAASSSTPRVTAAVASSTPGNADAFGSGGGGSGGGDGLPERPQKTTREVLSACALTLLRLLTFAAKHHECVGPNDTGITRPRSVETTGAEYNSNCENTDTTQNDSNIVIVNHNDANNGRTHFTRPPSVQHEIHERKYEGVGEGAGNTIIDTPNGNRDATRNHGGSVPDATITVVGSCLAHVAQAIDLSAGPRGALESVLTLLLPAAGLLVREQAALTLGAIAGQGFQLLTELREARAASAAVSSPGGGGGGGGGELLSGRDARGVMPGEEGGGRREGKRLLLWRLFCTGVVRGTGAQVGMNDRLMFGCLAASTRSPSARPSVFGSE